MNVEKYQDDLREIFAEQRRRNRFTDLIIVSSEGQRSRAHKALLSFLYPFWKWILSEDECNPSEETFVHLPDVNHFEIEDWLEKAYKLQNNPNPRRKRKIEPKRIARKSSYRFNQSCPDCSKEFKNAKTFYNHLKCHRPEEWKFKCDKCPDKSFMTNRHLSLHLSKEHQEGLTCPQCGKTYSSDSNLREHIQNVHESQTFSCELCGKIFASRAYLKSHQKLHNTKTAMKTCQICQKSFKGRYYYEHVKSHDKQNWRHSCGECGEKFLTKYKLLEHEALAHTGQARFPCEKCSQMFLTSARRAVHKKDCTGALFIQLIDE